MWVFGIVEVDSLLPQLQRVCSACYSYREDEKGAQCGDSRCHDRKNSIVDNIVTLKAKETYSDINQGQENFKF